MFVNILLIYTSNVHIDGSSGDALGAASGDTCRMFCSNSSFSSSSSSSARRARCIHVTPPRKMIIRAAYCSPDWLPLRHEMVFVNTIARTTESWTHPMKRNLIRFARRATRMRLQNANGRRTLVPVLNHMAAQPTTAAVHNTSSMGSFFISHSNVRSEHFCAVRANMLDFMVGPPFQILLCRDLRCT
jgi:hypothetical protein